MTHSATTFRLSKDLTDAIQKAARMSGEPVDAIVENVLRDAFLRGSGLARLRLARLVDALKDDFANARSWPELQGRLRLRGVDLRRHDTLLHVVEFPGTEILCPIDDLGETENRLAQRFGRQFPTASLAWFFDAGSDQPETDPQNADRVVVVAQAASG